VRSFQTNARIRSLTTGTFNRVVKDRIAFRLSGANSGLDGPATRADPAVLETLQTYLAAENPVNACIPQNFHVISTVGNWGNADAGRLNQDSQKRRTPSPKTVRFCHSEPAKPERNLLLPTRSTDARNGMAFRFERGAHFGARRSGRQKIEKRSYVWRSLL
jgi:hypothetical protein